MIGSTLSSIMVLNNALVFGDTDINTASFDNLDTIPVYRSPGARGWGGKIANNTAYNYRHSDQNLFILNDTYTISALSSDRTYDTDRKYVGKYIKLEIGVSVTEFVMPFGISSSDDALTTEWVLLTTSFQTLPKSGTIQIRALNAGGIQIRVTGTSIVTRYLLGSITECRKITGA